ncbi:MAG: aminodeoxychorismate/anthranilate synthase component II [Bacteroidales bacterium]
MKLLLIDNYDSFTYNLVELIRKVSDVAFDVVLNDQFDIQSVDNYDKILISPGPGLPEDAGKTQEVIRQYHLTKDILGVCLGHQAIAKTFGASLYNLESVYHGITGEIRITDSESSLFIGLPRVFQAGLYHSWAVSANGLPESLIPIAMSSDGIIMGLKHRDFNIYGLQFHPESVMTPLGSVILKNWLNCS